MQTIQQQPPPYTLPVIQPHLAQQRPNVKDGYKSYRVRRLAMAQIILGCFAFCFQLWDILNFSVFSVAAAGIWSGVFFISTGCLGLHSADQKTVCSIVSYMVMSIFSSFVAIGLLVLSSLNLDYYNKCNYYNYLHCNYVTGYQSTCTIILSTLLIVISLVEGFMAVFASCLACHGCCCSTTSRNVGSSVQYVQSPSGQLLLLTGQQLLFAPNPAVSQTAGVPMQTIVVPGQPYLSTTFVMPTQQQAGLVQPPPYQVVSEQAAGTQQPQVHQPAGKINTAYMDG